jgi:Protein of unknown function (DUF2490)
MRVFLFVVFCFTLFESQGQSLNRYHHNSFWGRLTFSDRISEKLRWEVFLQHRTQNDPDDRNDIFKHYQLSSYWLWLHYQATPNLRLSVTPFCYFNTISLYPQPASLGNRGIKEFRWAAQLEQTQQFRHFSFANRYSIEYRYRDLDQLDEFAPSYRIRYRARLDKPLIGGSHPLSATIFDEVMLEFGRGVQGSAAIFNQNRLFGGFTYDVLKNVRLNLGYIYIIQQRRSGDAVDISNVLWAVLSFDNIFSQFGRAKGATVK